jgi:hypothetical protein
VGTDRLVALRLVAERLVVREAVRQVSQDVQISHGYSSLNDSIENAKRVQHLSNDSALTLRLFPA